MKEEEWELACVEFATWCMAGEYSYDELHIWNPEKECFLEWGGGDDYEKEISVKEMFRFVFLPYFKYKHHMVNFDLDDE